MPRWTSVYSDRDLTFFMILYGNHDLADSCLRRLRKHFPGARVILRSDGDHDPGYPALAARHNAAYWKEERLFAAERGGAVVHRMLQIFLYHPTRYLFKIDPDTAIHRRFRYLPIGQALFGTIQGATEYRSIQGGFIGVTLEAARTMADSRLLLSPVLRRPPAEERSHLGKVALRARLHGLASFDWSLGWAAGQTDIELIDFPEVYSVYGEVVSIPDGEPPSFAATHPTELSKAGRRDARRRAAEGSLQHGAASDEPGAAVTTRGASLASRPGAPE